MKRNWYAAEGLTLAAMFALATIGGERPPFVSRAWLPLDPKLQHCAYVSDYGSCMSLTGQSTIQNQLSGHERWSGATWRGV